MLRPTNSEEHVALSKCDADAMFICTSWGSHEFLFISKLRLIQYARDTCRWRGFIMILLEDSFILVATVA